MMMMMMVVPMQIRGSRRDRGQREEGGGVHLFNCMMCILTPIMHMLMYPLPSQANGNSASGVPHRAAVKGHNQTRELRQRWQPTRRLDMRARKIAVH